MVPTVLAAALAPALALHLNALPITTIALAAGGGMGVNTNMNTNMNMMMNMSMGVSMGVSMDTAMPCEGLVMVDETDVLRIAMLTLVLVLVLVVDLAMTMRMMMRTRTMERCRLHLPSLLSSQTWMCLLMQTALRLQ